MIWSVSGGTVKSCGNARRHRTKWNGEMWRLPFLADERIKRACVSALRANGFDVVAVADGDSRGSDNHHLGTARDRSLIVIGNHDDFIRLAQEREHSGIVFIYTAPRPR
jgi:hypothetical protein